MTAQVSAECCTSFEHKMRHTGDVIDAFAGLAGTKRARGRRELRATGGQLQAARRPGDSFQVRRALDSRPRFRVDTGSMSECCCPPPEATSRIACPSCGTRGPVVEATTVKALLVPYALARLNHDTFYFCASPTCDVVYFSGTGMTFSKANLRVPVWQKTTPGARIVCYCFGENEADIQREIEDTGRTAAIERVRAHIADRRCACDVRNPRGACCLGDLTAAVKALAAPRTSELEEHRSCE